LFVQNTETLLEVIVSLKHEEAKRSRRQAASFASLLFFFALCGLDAGKLLETKCRG